MVLRLSAWGIFLLGAVGLLIHSTLLQTGHIRAGMFCFYTNPVSYTHLTLPTTSRV